MRCAALSLLLLTVVTPARAQPRPTLTGPELIYDHPGGRFRIHYTTVGADAPTSLADVAPEDGLPDLINDFSDGIDRAFTVFVDEDGWPAAGPDGGRGGDDRLDAYVRAIDSNGYAHYEVSSTGGRTAYLELNPRLAGTVGRVAARSVAAHELHHSLQAAVTVQLEPWIYEATATWAQYLLYLGDELLDLGREALWLIRLQGAAHPLDELGGRFEYSGMVWLKFLLDRGKAPRRAVLDLWRAMATAGGWEGGHAQALPALFGLTTVDDAVEQFHEWNLFACGRADGLHYDARDLPCTLKANVQAPPVKALPASGRVGAVGARGAVYLDVTPDCATDRLRARVSSAGRFAVRAVLVRGGGRSGSTRAASPAGGDVDLEVSGWNDAQRVVLVLVNLDPSQAASFDWQLEATGAYGPAPDLATATSLAVEPGAPLRLSPGQATTLRASAGFGSCADGADVTDRVTWRSSDDRVATVTAGRVEARARGLAEISASTDGATSPPVLVTVGGACGCHAAGGALPDPTPALAMLLLLALSRRPHPRGNAARRRRVRRAARGARRRGGAAPRAPRRTGRGVPTGP